MRNSLLHLLLILLFANVLHAQTDNIGIGTINPDPSAALDIQSTDKGLRIPSMTTAQRLAIASPATGLAVFDTEENSFFYWDGIKWFRIGLPTDGEINEFLKSDASGQAFWQPLINEEYLPEPNPTVLGGSLAVGGIPISVAVQDSFAYVVDQGSDDLKIINVLDPTSPVLRGSIAIGSIPISVAVQDSFAYVVDQGSDDLKIINILDPTSPVLRGSLAIGSSPVYVVVQDSFAYVVDQGSDDLKIINILDPTSPVLRGSIAVGSAPKPHAVQGNFAYVLDDNSNLLKIINVSDPVSPSDVSSIGVGNDPRSVVVQGNFSYVQGQGNLGVYNVSDPTNIVFTDYIGTFGGTIYTAVQGSYAYAINSSTDQLRIINISDPSDLANSIALAIGGNPTSIAVQGNYAYILDSSSDDLKIIKLSEVEAVGMNLNGELVPYTDPDADPTNEYNISAILNGTDLEITDGGGTKTVDLSSFAGSESTTVTDGNTVDLTLTGDDITAETILDPDAANILSSSAAGLKATETDPEVGTNTTNYLPKWDGTALVQSSSVFEDGSGNVGIGTTSPDPSAALDIQSTDKGLLIPRMTNAQITAIANPVIGLQVYSLDDGCIHQYDGTKWLMDCALEYDGSTLPPVDDNWTQLNDFPSAFGNRYGCISFTLNGVAYVGTGRNSLFNKDLWKYDPVLDSWTQLNDFPAAFPGRRDAVTFTIGGEVYVGLGQISGGYTDDLWKYDPVMDNWTQLNDLPLAGRREAIAFTVDDIAYVGTGYSGSLEKDLWKYDPAMDTWTQLSGFPAGFVARAAAVAFTVGGVAYVGTGNSNTSPHKDFWKYDPALDSWTQLNDFPLGRYEVTPFILDGEVYLGTGQTGLGTGFQKDLWKYKPATDTWVQLTDFPAGFAARSSSIAFTLGNIVYFGTGLGGGSDELWKYDPFNSTYLLTVSPNGDAAWIDPGNNNVINVDDADADPTNELQDWSNLPGIPAAFSDGTDDVDDADADPNNETITTAILNGTDLEITEAGGTMTVDLSSLAGDESTTVTDGNTVDLTLTGDDITAETILDPDAANILSSSAAGLKATETDPEVGTNTTNYLPKWDGTALVQSSSVFEDGSGNVGIGTTSPDPSAALDIQSTDKGLRIPSMTTAQRLAIASPATGLAVFDTEENSFFYWDGIKWFRIGLPTDGEINEFLKSDASGQAFWQPLINEEYLPEPNPTVLGGSLAVGGIPISVAVQDSFAYVVDQGSDDLKIINVLDPTSPVLRGSIAIGSIPISVAVQDSFAYVVDQGSDDLKIINILDPTSPVLRGSLAIGSSPVYVVVQDSFAYVVDQGSDDLKIINILDPTSPVLRGSIAVGSAPKPHAVQGNFAYVLDDNSNLLKIINVSDPVSPSDVSSIGVGNDPRSVVVQGNFSYVQGQGNLGVYNVSDPTNIVFTDYIGTFGGTIYTAVQGSYAYVINSNTDQLRIINISDPFNLANSIALAIGGNPTSVAVQGNYAYVVDSGSDDLKIIKLSEVGAVGMNLNGELVSYTDPDADPTNELQDWSNLPGIPAAFSDGTDDVDDADADPNNETITSAILNGTDLEITDAGGTKTVDLSSLAGAESTTVTDGNSIDLTLTGDDITAETILDPDAANILSSSGTGLKATETDPEVGANTTNYLPKWDGTALVQSSSVFEDGSGNVGIGTNNPEGPLHVGLPYGVNAVAIEQLIWTNWSPFIGDIWQSFTTTFDGRITSIDLATEITGTVTLSIYEGTGTGGTLIYSESKVSPFTNSLNSPFVLATPLTVSNSTTYTFRIESPAFGFFGENNSNPYAGGESNLGSGNDYQFKIEMQEVFGQAILVTSSWDVGIGRTAVTNKLEVEGDASKSSAGDWLANSDARLKKNIQQLNSQEMLQRLLALQGVTYEWDDDKTGSQRPEGTMYGFTAQNIQQVFPELVEEDNLGYLQTAYGTYDAMYVEAIRAQQKMIDELKAENEKLRSDSDELKSRMAKIEAALMSTSQK